MKGFNMGSIAKLGKMGLAAMNRNLPSILSGAAIAGLVATIWTTYKAAPEIESAMESAKWDKVTDAEEKAEDGESVDVDNVTLNAWETFKAVAPYVWKPVACGVFTAGCIVGAQVLNVQRLTMLAGAYKLSEEKLKTYEEKAKEILGDKKAEEVHDAMAKELTPDVPDDPNNIISTKKGDMLCYDIFSGRYFRSSVEAIRTAESKMNKRLANGDYATVNELYIWLDLPCIKLGDHFGWNVNDWNLNSTIAAGKTVDINLTYEAREINGEQKVVCVLDYDTELDDFFAKRL